VKIGFEGKKFIAEFSDGEALGLFLAFAIFLLFFVLPVLITIDGWVKAK
jgi:hypothetical protein